MARLRSRFTCYRFIIRSRRDGRELQGIKFKCKSIKRITAGHDIYRVTAICNRESFVIWGLRIRSWNSRNFNFVFFPQGNMHACNAFAIDFSKVHYPLFWPLHGMDWPLHTEESTEYVNVPTYPSGQQPVTHVFCKLLSSCKMVHIPFQVGFCGQSFRLSLFPEVSFPCRSLHIYCVTRFRNLLRSYHSKACKDR